MSKTRIYLVEDAQKKYLVDTTSVGAALSTVAKRNYKARMAKPSEIVQLMRGGGATIIQGGDDAQVDVEDVTGSPSAPQTSGEPPLEFGGAQSGK